MLYAGAPILLLGLAMLARGWIYTLWPNGRVAEKRKRRNLKVGFTTDMKLFGRRIRRLGLMISLVGSGLVAWHFTTVADDARAQQAALPSPAPSTAP
jgi:hypothetical protein